MYAFLFQTGTKAFKIDGAENGASAIKIVGNKEPFSQIRSGLVSLSLHGIGSGEPENPVSR
jgi:hypothetical protein